MSEQTTALYYAIVFLVLGAMSAAGAGAATAAWSLHAVGIGATTALCWLLSGSWLVEYMALQTVRLGELVEAREMPVLPRAEVRR